MVASGPAPRTLVNGQPATQVAALDRGLSYGDGVFRTLRIDAGAPRWWSAHMDKLSADCARLGLDCPPEPIWRADLERLGLPESGLLRLTLTRGEGPRGYAPPVQATPTRIVSVWPGAHNDQPARGITGRICRLRLGHQTALAGVKHLNRLENVLARAEWSDPDILEGILLDQDGRVVSGVMSNLFIFRGGELLTPPLDRCGVAGVARARLLAVASAAGFTVGEVEMGLEDILRAEEVLFTNSAILLWRLARLEDRVWDQPLVSPDLWERLYA